MYGSTTATSRRPPSARSSVPPARLSVTISASSPVRRWSRSMYRYDEFDAQFVAERVEQFRYQVARRLSGTLNEDEFKPLRLMNGLYLQLHAYMLRIAVPYGT